MSTSSTELTGIINARVASNILCTITHPLTNRQKGDVLPKGDERIRCIYKTPYGTPDRDPTFKKVILLFRQHMRERTFIMIKPVVKIGLRKIWTL